MNRWRRGDAASAVVAPAFPVPAALAHHTPEGVARLAVGALLAAGWVLVPPAPPPRQATPPPARLADLIERREHARQRNDFAAADALRAEAAALGYAITDTPAGPEWAVLSITA